MQRNRPRRWILRILAESAEPLPLMPWQKSRMDRDAWASVMAQRVRDQNHQEMMQSHG